MTDPEKDPAGNTIISEFAGFVSEGGVSERALINLLEEIMEIVSSRHALKSSFLWGFNFTELWPFESLRGLGEGKTSRWLQHRFP